MKKEKKEYEIFVQNIEDKLPEDKAVILTVKDLTPGPRKYENRIVKAIVYRSSEKLPDGDILRIRSWTGIPYPEHWHIRIIEEVGELLDGVPHGETLNRRW